MAPTIAIVVRRPAPGIRFCFRLPLAPAVRRVELFAPDLLCDRAPPEDRDAPRVEAPDEEAPRAFAPDVAFDPDAAFGRVREDDARAAEPRVREADPVFADAFFCVRAAAIGVCSVV